VLLVLGPGRDSPQKGNRQQRHTHLHAKTHSSSYIGWVKAVYGLPHVVTRSFFEIFRPDNQGERAAHFAGNSCWYLVMSTDCQSPLIMPARICAAVLPLRDC